MVNLLTELFTNNIFLSIFVAVVISQLIKILIIIFKHSQKYHLNDLIATGGMPSTHSTLVSSLTTIIYLNQGLSPLFFVVLTFSLIVLLDSIGVRRSVGEEGKIIEKIIKFVKFEKIKLNKFHLSLGHNPKQVFVGIVIGFISAIFSFNFLNLF